MELTKSWWRGKTLIWCKGLSPSCFYGLGSAVSWVLAVSFKDALTRTMSMHMLVHIPLIVASGALACRAWSLSGYRLRGRFSDRISALYQACSRYGLAGLAAVSFIGVYWMIPKALDSVLLSVWVDLSKFVLLFFAGALLIDSVERANAVIKLFFIGNFCWMMAIAGILYQDDSVRLCNFYLLDDQSIAGKGLVVLAVILPILWLALEAKAVRRFLR